MERIVLSFSKNKVVHMLNTQGTWNSQYKTLTRESFNVLLNYTHVYNKNSINKLIVYVYASKPMIYKEAAIIQELSVSARTSILTPLFFA
jgi:hypothetical protein